MYSRHRGFLLERRCISLSTCNSYGDWSGSWSNTIYFSTVRRFSVLPASEIMVLFDRFKNGNCLDRVLIKDQLVEHHQGMLLSIVKRFSPQSRDEQMDFIQECNMALCDAIDSFDANRRVRFSTYAYTVLIRKMFDCVRKKRMIFESHSIPSFFPLEGALESGSDFDDSDHFSGVSGFEYDTPESVYVTTETRLRIRRILQQLPNLRQRTMIQ
jgi:RNA polymerase sigma factor (sigma-70 family)